MKPFRLLLAASAFCSPLAAQNEGPGNDLIDLFEKSQREGATDEQLMRMLEDKALLDLRKPEFRELWPEQLQHEKDAGLDLLRLFNGQVPPGEPGPGRDDAAARRMLEGPPSDLPPRPPQWLVGLVVKPLGEAMRPHFNLPDGVGVIVESVMRDGPAARAGIGQNDIIVTANGRGISSLEELKEVVEMAGRDGKAVNLEVIQRGKRSVVPVAPRGPEPLGGEANLAGRPLMEIQRRLNAQEQQIEELRREVRQLRERIDRE